MLSNPLFELLVYDDCLSLQEIVSDVVGVVEIRENSKTLFCRIWEPRVESAPYRLQH